VKLIFATLVLLTLAVSTASAGYTCTQWGNRTVCTDDGGGSTTCTRWGNRVVCN
jgi:hypothetical protein